MSLIGPSATWQERMDFRIRGSSGSEPARRPEQAADDRQVTWMMPVAGR